MKKLAVFSVGMMFVALAASCEFMGDGPADQLTTLPGDVKAEYAIPLLTPPATQLSSILKPNDRIVFVGDDVTQDMFYTRAIATALLPIMPDANLRLYNAGKEGATAATFMEPAFKGKPATAWEDLADLCKPTVVFVCLASSTARAIRPATS